MGWIPMGRIPMGWIPFRPESDGLSHNRLEQPGQINQIVERQVFLTGMDLLHTAG